MKSKNIQYLTREGIKNIGINRLMTVASVAVLMSCLVIIGFALMLFFNVDSLLQNIEKQNVVMAFCEVGADDDVVALTKTMLDDIDNIDTCDIVSKEDAYNYVADSLGEDADILKNIDDKFLPVGFRITIKDMSAFSDTVTEIGAIESVSSIQQNTDIAEKLREVRTAVTYISVGIILVLFVVSMFIIANTIRITMFSRKLEISIMKAVGATNWFIRWPFLVEGVFIGLISAFISFFALAFLYGICGPAFTSIFSIFGNSIVSFWDYSLQILVGFIFVSVFTGGFGSLISMRKYLKEQGSVVLDEN